MKNKTIKKIAEQVANIKITISGKDLQKAIENNNNISKKFK